MALIQLPAVFKKSFLDGDGTIKLTQDENLLDLLLKSDKPFPDNLTSGTEKVMTLEISAARNQSVKLGDRETLALDIKAGGVIKAELDILVGDEYSSYLKEYDLALPPVDTMYLLLRAAGKADIAAALSDKWSNLGLGASFGVNAGGEIAYTCLQPFPMADHTSKDVLKRFFSGIHFPQSASIPDHIPAEGAMLALTYGGYLKAAADTSWGYSVSKNRSVSAGELDLSARIEIQAKAKLQLGYSLAGNFDLQAKRGGQDGWLRVIVKKSKNRQFEMAADINIGAETEVSGLPDEPDGFLEALLEIRTPDLVKRIEKVLAADAAALKKMLGEKVDPLTTRVFEKYLGKTLQELEGNAVLQDAWKKMQEIKEIHDGLGTKLTGYLEDRLDDVGFEDYLDKALGEIKNVTKDLVDASGLKKITDTKIWELLKSLAGEDVTDLVENTDGAFDKAREKILALKQENITRLKEFIDAKKEELNLNKLFNILKHLEPSQLKETAEGHLKELVHRLTGKVVDELQDSALGEFKQQLNDLLNKLDDFKEKLYKQFQDTLNDTYRLSIAYGYRHASADDALLDVEINLGAVPSAGLLSGQDLAKAALGGDFSAVYQHSAPDRVRIHQGVLTHRVSRASRLSLDLFGWKYERLYELVTKTRETVQQKSGGVLHVYDTRAISREEISRQGEKTETELAFTVLAQGFQPTASRRATALDAVNAMQSKYTMRIDDDLTERDELIEYLRFADYLKLIPREYDSGNTTATDQPEHVSGLLAEIAAELGISGEGDYGNVRIDYTVSYDADALFRIFKRDPAHVRPRTLRALRRVASFAYKQFPPFKDISAVYPVQAFHDYVEREGLKTNTDREIEYTVGNKRVKLSKHERINLDHLYDLEDDFLTAFTDLQNLLRDITRGEKPDISQLEKRLKKFIAFQVDLDTWFGFGGRSVIPPFLAVINHLIRWITFNRAWTASLEMIFTRGDKKVTRILVS